MNYDEILYKLSRSKFRSSFHLREYMIEYINEKGMNTIQKHAKDFITNRLNPNNPKDGKQTPMKGHPVFIAQHACACCCRGCLEKWYHIPKDRHLSENEINSIVTLLMLWIKKEYQNIKVKGKKHGKTISQR